MVAGVGKGRIAHTSGGFGWEPSGSASRRTAHMRAAAELLKSDGEEGEALGRSEDRYSVMAESRPAHLHFLPC